MKEVALSGGGFAIVDDDDYQKVSQFKWGLRRSGHTNYALRSVRIAGRSVSVSMHRQIMAADGDAQVDHKNHDGLDNRRDNLRLCTPTQNARNTRPCRGGTSSYKGVCWHGQNKRWRATIKLDGKQISLGQYKSEEHAARIYDDAARKLFGEFACPNFDDVQPVQSTARVKRSRFRGVTQAGDQRWRAFIHVDGVLLALGSYDTEDAAARAHDAVAATQRRGRASLNFPDEAGESALAGVALLARLDRARAERPAGKMAAKVTVAQVLEMRQRHGAGESLAAIGRAFSVTYQCVSDIVRHRTWRDVA